MHAADTGLLDQLEGPLEGLVVLVGEAHDHVGRDVDVRDRVAQPGDRLEVFPGVVVAAHRRQHPVVARLQRHVQVRAHLRLARQRLQDRVAHVDHLDRGDPHPLHPGDPGRAHQQLAEVEAGGGVAVVADADPRHHDLALVLLHAAAHLVEDRRGRARAGAPAHGRDDAVGAVAVTPVLDLHESPRAGPRPGVVRCPRGAPERDLVLEVDARAARLRRLAPPGVAILTATSSAVPVKVLTPGSISSNWDGRRLTAQPATYTSRAVCSERRTDWRDFASASRVMQQVLITCSSASFSATSSWPACEQLAAGQHGVGLGDLAAEELDREAHRR